MNHKFNGIVKKTIKIDGKRFCNIDSIENDEREAEVYVGRIHISEIIGISTERNVRSYLAGKSSGKKFNGVHKAIKGCLKSTPDEFCAKNGGICVVADKMAKNGNKITLTNPGIVNGAQTQGVIEGYLKEIKDDKESSHKKAHVKVEFVVSEDRGFANEISIARNNQTKVSLISIVGTLGMLDAMFERVKDVAKRFIKKSESDPNSYVDTAYNISMGMSLVSDHLTHKGRLKETNKSTFYNNRDKWLNHYIECYKAFKNENGNPKSDEAKTYSFLVEFMPNIINLIEKWNTHQGWAYKDVKVTTSQQNVQSVSKGLISPIIAAYAALIRPNKNGEFEFPEIELDNEMDIIEQIEYEYHKHDRDAHKVGRTESVYHNVRAVLLGKEPQSIKIKKAYKKDDGSEDFGKSFEA